MLIHISVRLRGLAVFLLLAVFSTCAQGSSDTFSSTFSSTSMSSVTPLYGNATSITSTSFPIASSSGSTNTAADMGITSPASPGSSIPSINSTGTPSPTRPTTPTPIASVMETMSALIGNGTIKSHNFTSSSSSGPMSGVANTRISPGSAGTPSFSLTSSFNGSSPSIMTTSSPISNPTGNATSNPSSSAGGSTPTLLNCIGSFKYQGCAASAMNFSSFTLVGNSPSMTLDKCVAQCGAGNYTYAGIQSTNCYCANSLTSDVMVTPGQGSCTVLCPGNTTEFCGGKTSSAKRGLRKREAPGGVLLSLFANTPVFGNSAIPKSSNPSSSSVPSTNTQSTSSVSNNPIYTAGIPATNTTSESGLGISTTPKGSGILSPTRSTTGKATAPFGNGTSPGSTGPPTASLTASFTTASGALFGNESSTIFQSSFRTASLDPTPMASSRSPVSSILSPSIQASNSLNGSGIIGSIPTIGPPASPTIFFGFTITEIVFTTTTYCPATISTIISGVPAYFVTDSVSTVIFTSTIVIPCHECLKPSYMITLPPAMTTSGLYQSPSSQPSDLNEILVTEIIYTTVSICPVTTGKSIFSGSTSYHVTNIMTTLTRTATTTVPCQNCHPLYATVTVMLIGASPTSSSENLAGTSEAPSLSITSSRQHHTNGAGQASCPSCSSPQNADIGMETMGGTIIITSSPPGPPNAAQAISAQTNTALTSAAQTNAAQTITALVNVAQPNVAQPNAAQTITALTNAAQTNAAQTNAAQTISAEATAALVNVALVNAAQANAAQTVSAQAAAAAPVNVAQVNTAQVNAAQATATQVNSAQTNSAPVTAAQASTQGSMYGGAQNIVPASSNVTATSTPIIHGPYRTSNSRRSKTLFRQTIVLGLLLAVGAGLAML